MKKVKVVVCIDDNQGMLFNHRRQSRDSHVYKDIAELTKTIWLNHFSKVLFVDTSIQLQEDENFLEKSQGGEWCFVENVDLTPYMDKVEQFIIYKWNRTYPADLRLNIDFNHWTLQQVREFKGSSHDKITREIYIRG